MIENRYAGKIKTAAELAEVLGPMPREKKAIMCHGTFDVVHPGHVRHLLYASSKADLVIASLTADVHIKKGNLRPYVPEEIRAMNLAAFEMVDYVVIDPNATPLENLKIIQPDLFAKGYDYITGGTRPETQAEIDIVEAYGGEVIFTPGDVVYSSSRLIETAPPNIGPEKLANLLQAEGLTFADLTRTLDGMSGKKVHIVGDTIVDTITETSMIGGNAKTPTLSVRLGDVRHYVGGAGIVAKHMAAAGADVTFTTLLGDDANKDFVVKDLEDAGIHVNPIIDKTRPTTEKNAIVCQNHRMLKVDAVDNTPINPRVQDKFSKLIASTQADAVVFSDFRHGIFSAQTIETLVAAIPDGVFRAADSQVASRWGNICEFQGFDLITPNEKEARFSLADQDSVVRPLAAKLFEAAQCKNLILKMGSRGLIGHRQPKDDTDYRAFFVIDSFAGQVLDPVGAGDALLAYATLAHLSRGHEVIAAILGAMAASTEVEMDGNIPVRPAQVREKIEKVRAQVTFEVHEDATPETA